MFFCWQGSAVALARVLGQAQQITQLLSGWPASFGELADPGPARHTLSLDTRRLLTGQRGPARHEGDVPNCIQMVCQVNLSAEPSAQ